MFIRLTLPEGLEEALEGLAREVLRTQPENIYEFAANHFDQILKKRTNVKEKPEKDCENGEKVDGVDEDDGTEIENIEERTATPEDTQVRSRPASSKPRKSIDIQMPSNQEAEEVDIDLTDPDVEMAATKIQAGFKGHKTRKEMKERKADLETTEKEDTEEIDIDLEDPDVEMAATKIQASFKGHKTRKEMREKTKEVEGGGAQKEDKVEIEKKNENEEDESTKEEVIDIDLTDPDVEAAATKIQAGFKGHKTRKEMKSKNEKEGEEEQKPSELKEDAKEEEEVVDIDLTDPDVEAAATKIQAGFKGHKTRKEMKSKSEKEAKEEHEKEEEEAIDIDLTDPDVEAAATKIQAGFKGHKTRKQMKETNLTKDSELDETAEKELKDPDAEKGSDKEKDQHEEDKDRKEENEKDKEEVIDIDLADPDVEAAATKIQAGFKGHKTRKEMKCKKEIKDEESATNKVDEGEKMVGDEEEAIDIDLTDPEVEAAATKIQAGFKGHKTRKEMQSKKEADDKKEEVPEISKAELESEDVIDIDINDPEVEAAATKIQAGFKGHKARKQLKEQRATTEIEEVESGGEETKAKEEATEDTATAAEDDEVIDIDLTDPDVEAAATKIQAGFKGHKTRRDMKKSQMSTVTEKDKEQDEPAKDKSEKDETKEEEIDIDLNDPEVEAAATKIQAGFKGHKTRKEMKEKEAAEVTTSAAEDDEVIDIDLNDPEVEAAATKIQAGFKGHKTRKEMKEAKSSQADDDKTNDEADKAVKADENEIDIDLDDPEVEAAATKIQAGFKGHKARKQVKELQSEKKEEEKDDKTEEGIGEKKEGDHEEKKEEEIDIDLTDPDVEAAATKIQAGFKGHKARKEVSQMKTDKDDTAHPDTGVEDAIDIDLNDPEVEAAATKIQAGFKGHKARKEVSEMKINSDKSEQLEASDDTADVVDIDLTDPDVEAAATKIQAGFKGHKARKEVAEMKENKDIVKDDGEKKFEGEDDIDIDLNDPEVEAAATKIQAGFKGHKARKEVTAMKNTEDVTTKNEEEIVDEVIDIDLTDPDVEAAATKIQAGFKGHKARKEVSDMKNKTVEDNAETKEDKDEAKETTTPKGEDEIDIDLNDPEVEAAATKIQAGFKGHKARKEVSKLKEDQTGSQVEEKSKQEDSDKVADEEEVDIDLEDPEVAAAATKIQAGFKGHKARKEVKELQAAKEEAALVSESQTNEGIVVEEPAGVDNKDIFRRESSELLTDDGYNSLGNWKSNQSTFDSALTTPESSFDDSKPGEEEVRGEKTQGGLFSDSSYSVSSLVLAVAGSALSAPVIGSSKEKSSSDAAKDNSISEQKANSDEDSQTVETTAAALTIQSGFRGMRDRRRVGKLRRETALDDLDSNYQPRLDDLAEQDEDMAATVLQAGVKQYQVQKQFSLKLNKDDNKLDKEEAFDISENSEELGPKSEKRESIQVEDELVIIRESSAESNRVGAIPFELHEAYDKSNEPNYQNEENEDNETKSKKKADLEDEEHHDITLNRECSMVTTKEVDQELDNLKLSSNNLSDIPEVPEDAGITLSIDSGAPESLKVLLYLKERGIPHRLQIEDGIFLPALPALKHGENELSGGQSIITYLEQRLPVDLYPMMIPCTSSTKAYQKFIFFSSLLDNTDLAALTLGVINYPELRVDQEESVNIDLAELKMTFERALENEAGNYKR